MKLSLVHTPNEISPSIKNACKRLSGNEPEFVDVNPPSWAKVNKCSLNAKRYTEEHGGEVVFGWALAVWDKVLLDCIGHAVVKIDGELIDVTPNKYNDKRLLFVKDDEIDFDFSNVMSRMPSKNISLSSSKEAKRLVSIENEMYNIKIKYPVTSGNVELSPDDSKKYLSLEREKQIIVPRIIVDHTHHNDPCICSSGKKFRKCCQHLFKRMA